MVTQGNLIQMVVRKRNIHLRLKQKRTSRYIKPRLNKTMDLHLHFIVNFVYMFKGRQLITLYGHAWIYRKALF